MQAGFNLLRIHFRDRIWLRTDVAGLEAEKKKQEKEIAKGGGTLDKGARENETLPQGGGEEGWNEGEWKDETCGSSSK